MPGTGGGVKLCGRNAVNPSLPADNVRDPSAFLRVLRAKLGEPDNVADANYSYSIRDLQTGVEFMAYSAQSGPAYGGSPVDCFVDFENNDYRLKPAVLETLTDFERWLGS